ncbi:hypothetical protein N9K77_01790 [bacterium]|nr:hypothetical protein [bacterium]
METTIMLLKKFIDLGYKKVITTPHVMSDYYKNTPVGQDLCFTRKNMN